MIGAVRDFANRLLGRGDATITVPSFDGALKPNQRLEAARDRARVRRAGGSRDRRHDALSSPTARGLLRLEARAATEAARFDRPISALACLPDGGLAVALGGREVRVYADACGGEAAGRVRQRASMPSTRLRRRRTAR